MARTETTRAAPRSAIATWARTFATRGRRSAAPGSILAIMVVLYLAWTLTVYFIEPGLR